MHSGLLEAYLIRVDLSARRGSSDLLVCGALPRAKPNGSPGLQDTELIHFEKVRDGNGVIAPASAGRDRPVRLRSGQDFLSEQAVRSPRDIALNLQ
jgi:hypothetical protein